MILGTQLPSWKQILKCNKTRKNNGYYSQDEYLFLAESCMSINLIINAYKNVYNKKNVNVYVPDYFCNQTIISFKESWMNICYYDVTDNMDPDWNHVRHKLNECEANIFIFTHFFGKYHADICLARELCDQNDTILIEDCAHVLYPTGKIGQKGDFVIYSPHKQIPVKDAGVIQINANTNNDKVCKELYRLYDLLDVERSDVWWYIKKSIQKLIPIHRKLLYYPGVHIGENVCGFKKPKKISKVSYNTLCDYNYQKIKKIAYIRRDNLLIMNYIMQKKFDKIIVCLDDLVDVPYLSVYSMKDMENKEKVTESLLKEKYTLLHWPDLPYQLSIEAGHEVAKSLSENIITFPIHQGVTPQKLLRKFDNFEKITIKHGLTIIWEDFSQKDWNDVFQKYRVTNIPQEWTYGNAKAATEGWFVKRALLYYGNEAIGTLQLLERRILKIAVAVRVNRGPLFIPEYDVPENHYEVMRMVRKRYFFPIPIFYAPFIEFGPESLETITAYGWRQKDLFGFPSANIDLTKSVEELNMALKPNWRKNLKKAIKEVNIKYNEYVPEDLISKYEDFLKKKNIPGIPEHILQYLFKLEKPPLEILTAHNSEGIMIAYKVLYIHGNTATSFIAWNTDEGLKKNARTLLIYSSMLRLKNMGCKNFDLGGVDDINTEAVAKYKRGMGGRDYRLLGEFIKF